MKVKYFCECGTEIKDKGHKIVGKCETCLKEIENNIHICTLCGRKLKSEYYVKRGICSKCNPKEYQDPVLDIEYLDEIAEKIAADMEL